jgi:hypothetical protein
MTPPAPTSVAYHAGRCALCDRPLAGVRDAQEVRLHVFGPVGAVILRSWLCPPCRPTPATESATSRALLRRVLDWYRSTPSVWPTLRLGDGA